MTTGEEASAAPDVLHVQAALEDRLADHFGHRRSISRLVRRMSPYSSSFRIDELELQFTDGLTLQLILKDLSRDAMLEEAQRARPAFLYDPLREIGAYGGILSHAPFGPPISFGAVSDTNAGRYWLFLEQVSGPQLAEVGNFATWERVAAWIARFHDAFSPLQARQLADRFGVMVYDEAFYRRWLRRALRFAGPDSEARRVVAGVARCYGGVIDRLVRLPPALIHGELYPCNVIVGKTSDGERVCPVDWEMVALGPGLTDLAALSAGWSEVKQRALARAYYAAARNGRVKRSSRPARVPADFMTDLDCCRLHLAVCMLGWSDNWQAPAEHATNWLEEAARIVRRLQS